MLELPKILVRTNYGGKVQSLKIKERVLKLKKEQIFEFSIPKSNFDTEVRKTSSTCLILKNQHAI